MLNKYIKHSFFSVYHSPRRYNRNLTLFSNGTSTNQNLSLWIRCRQYSGTLRYKRITSSRLEDQTWWSLTKIELAVLVDFAVLWNHRLKIEESENIKKYLNLTVVIYKLRKKNTVEHESGGNTICYWCSWNGSQGLGEGTGGIGNHWKNWDHPDNSLAEII